MTFTKLIFTSKINDTQFKKAPLLFYEEKEKFKIFSIRLPIGILVASMLILEEKEQFKNFQVPIQIAASRRERD